MKKVIFLFFVLFFGANVLAVGIRPSILVLDFEPNFHGSYTFNVYGADNIELYTKGDMEHFVSLNQTIFHGRSDFVVTIDFPIKSEKPGKHTVFLGARELAPQGGMISAAAAIQVPIKINVPWEGKYIEASFSAYNMNVDEQKDFKVTVRNTGTKNLSRVGVILDIDEFPANKTIDTIRSESVPLLHGSSVEFTLPIDSRDYNAGSYKAIATIYYDEFALEKVQNFMIGELDVKVLDYPKRVYNGTINKFPITVESGWNNGIKNVYAKVDVIDNNSVIVASEAKTQSVDLKPWSKGVIHGYLDTTGVDVGYYDLLITVYYEDKTTVVRDTIEVGEKEFLSEFRLSGLNLLLLSAVAFLVLLDIGWIVVKRFRNKAAKNSTLKKKVRKKRK